MTRWIKRLFARPSSPQAPKVRLGLESLDRRDLPSISLVGTELLITGNHTRDLVAVTTNYNGTLTPYDDKVVVLRRFGVGGNPSENLVTDWLYEESATFSMYTPTRTGFTQSVKSIKCDLKDGWNEFDTNTSLPSAVYGGKDPDVLKGGWGADRLYGKEGSDALWGEGGDDQLFAGDGSDYLYGGQGRDVLVSVGGGADSLYGGDMNSRYGAIDSYWHDAGDSVEFSFFTDPPPAAVNHTIASFESLTIGSTKTAVGLTPNGEDLLEPTSFGTQTVTREDFAGNPLFASVGPRFDDIDQGAVGDCYFLARLSSLADKNPGHVREMVVDLGDGTYAVQFLDSANARRFVRVDGDLWVTAPGVPHHAGLGAESSLWVPIVEKAYAFYRNREGTYASIDGGNSPTHVGGTSKALGCADTEFGASSVDGLAFAYSILNELNKGKAVIMGGPGTLTNDTKITDANRCVGTHIRMVHSVETNAQGVPTRIFLYDLSGKGLTEFTNFDLLLHTSGGAKTVVPM